MKRLLNTSERLHLHALDERQIRPRTDPGTKDPLRSLQRGSAVPALKKWGPRLLLLLDRLAGASVELR